MFMKIHWRILTIEAIRVCVLLLKEKKKEERNLYHENSQISSLWPGLGSPGKAWCIQIFFLLPFVYLCSFYLLSCCMHKYFTWFWFLFYYFRQSRLTAYRQFVCWMLRGDKLGKGNRVVIPACVVNAIRKKFPEPSEHYIGFRSAIENIRDLFQWKTTDS